MSLCCQKKFDARAQTQQACKCKGWDEISQLIQTKTKKVVCSALKKANYGKNHYNRHEESDSNSDFVYWSVGSASSGNLHVVKKT